MSTDAHDPAGLLTDVDVAALMEATKGHTPGPWVATRRAYPGGGWHLGSPSAGHTILDTETAFCGVMSPSEADAALIASAPALLRDRAALQRERDAAVAHDRQPYPTVAAYEAACAAMDKYRAEAAERDALASQLLDMQRSRDAWQEDARMYCRNADYWHARVAALGAALRGLLGTWDRAESNRGCYSCCEQHDSRCELSRGIVRPGATVAACTCGRVELDAAAEVARAALASAPAVELPEPLPDVGGLAWVEVGKHDEAMALKVWDTRSRAWRYATRYEAETVLFQRDPPAVEPGAATQAEERAETCEWCLDDNPEDGAVWVSACGWVEDEYPDVVRAKKFCCGCGKRIVVKGAGG